MAMRKRSARQSRRELMDMRARELRNAPTDAEYRLWYFLRARQLDNVKFRRQAPIGPFIVDFVTFERKLVIELDGGQHQQQQTYDAHGTDWLNARGYRVLRFWNHQVREEIEPVLEVIWNALQQARPAGPDGAAG